MIIKTTDDVYTYTNADYDNKYTDEQFKIDTNLKVSSTQGFQVKKQAGQIRIIASVKIADLMINIADNLLPMLNYPVPVEVSFERIPPMRTSNIMKMELIAFKILQEFNNGNDTEIEIQLVEVIGV